MVIIATRQLKDEEIFVNYRLNPKKNHQDWYFQPFPEEAERRWQTFGILNLIYSLIK